MSKLVVRDLTPSTLEVATEQVIGGFGFGGLFEEIFDNNQDGNNFNVQGILSIVAGNNIAQGVRSGGGGKR